jgi:NTE family protein
MYADYPVPTTTGPRKTALVLGGGGAFGVVQAACIQAAFERGFRPDLVVGTSVGACNGAWVAMHPDEPERLLEIWAGLGAMKMVRLNPLRVARRAFRGTALCQNEIVSFLMDAHVGPLTFEDASLAFAVIATNLSRGTKRIFRTGSMARAIGASSAIPGVFEPVEIDGELYVDGCLTASCDMLTAIEMGATEILAIDLTPLPEHRRPRSVAGVLRQSLKVLGHSTTDAMEAMVAREATLHVLRPNLESLSPWRLDVAPADIQRHLREARATISDALDREGRVIPRPLIPREEPAPVPLSPRASRWHRVHYRLPLRHLRPTSSAAASR